MFFKDYQIREVIYKNVDLFRRELTFLKCYTAYVLKNGEYYLMNDLGYFAGYSSHFFYTLEEWREKQIEKIID